MNEALAKALWGNAVPESETRRAATCADCGNPTEADPCPGCQKIVCQPCADAEGEFCYCLPLASGAPCDTTTGEVPFEPDETPKSGWDPTTRSLTSMDGLAWAARKLREAQEQVDLNFRVYDDEVKRIEEECNRRLAKAEERRTQACRPFEQGVSFFESLITVYATQNRAEVLKGLPKSRKSRLLSGVRIGWKKRRAGFRMDQSMPAAERDAALLDWAMEIEEGPVPASSLGLDDLTEHTPSVVLEAVKRYADATGETPPGMERVPESEELRIETGIDLKGEES